MRVRVIATLCAAAAIVLGVFGGSAGAVTNGTFDGNGHPYVGYLDNGVFACSGTLLSPTVLLTAAHCFNGSTSAFGTNSATGAPLVRASFNPNFLALSPAQRTWSFGSYYFDPDFAEAAGGGVPGFATHDIAIVIFTSAGCTVPPNASGIKSCGPIPASATLNQYGALPREGVVDTLRENAPIDLVGYGVQNFVNGGGPCNGPCKKTPGDAFTRFFAPTTLVSSNNSISDEFIKLHANKGGVCFGDSGGPDLLAGTNVVVAVNSFGNGTSCQSNTYSYRADTAQALDWVNDTVDDEGGSLP